MNEMENLYQEIILEHSKKPNGFVDASELKSCSTVHGEHAKCSDSKQFNPTCGDNISMHVETEKPKADVVDVDAHASDTTDADPLDVQSIKITSVIWSGQGCSISQASTSVMIELVEGKTVKEVKKIYDAFLNLMNSKGEFANEDDEELLEDATAFAGVSKFPMRIKCALLGWEALKDCLLKLGIKL